MTKIPPKPLKWPKYFEIYKMKFIGSKYVIKKLSLKKKKKKKKNLYATSLCCFLLFSTINQLCNLFIKNL